MEVGDKVVTKHGTGFVVAVHRLDVTVRVSIDHADGPLMFWFGLDEVVQVS